MVRLTDKERSLVHKAYTLEIELIEGESTSANKYLVLFKHIKNGAEMTRRVNAMIDALYAHDNDI